ncbi:hypothetical protein [Opitutus terrae]|uniref:Type 4a pilus biogenesis protein PilO n=1 Tax=Opitutus terrae (strain DSM 11246 / JCM 15787 / PB90-1) TaxID=452637 RepID=B1ZTI6_OPITP|nr:hypothetical protein [Opitutus terrae]ACB73931.1 hypothetical protein Oter_0641 [Opitutus terrae PB90-1]
MAISNADFVAFLKRNPISVGCGVLSLILAIAIFYRSSAVPEAMTTLDEKSREGARLATNLRNATQLPEQLEQLNTAVKAIDARLVRAADLAQNLQYFYRLEAETGVKLIDLRQNQTAASAKPAAGALGGVGFTISMQGEYFALLEVIRRLENGTHYARVINCNLRGSGPDRTGPVNLAMDVELLGMP